MPADDIGEAPLRLPSVVQTAFLAGTAVVPSEPGHEHQRVDITRCGTTAHAGAAVVMRARHCGDRLLNRSQPRDSIDERTLVVIPFHAWPS